MQTFFFQFNFIFTMRKTITIFLFFYSFTLNAQCPTNCPFNFSSKRTEDKVLIEWTVLNEDATICYNVERSTNGVNFETIAVVKCENKKQYNYTDDFKLMAYYRVTKQYQTRTEKTAVMFVEVYSKKMVIYPNPAPLGARVNILGEKPIRIYNILGNLVRELHEDMYIDDLPRGMYIVKSDRETSRLLIQ